MQREDTAKNVATTEVGGGNKRELYTRISLCYLSGDELLLIKKLLAKRTVEHMSDCDHHDFGRQPPALFTSQSGGCISACVWTLSTAHNITLNVFCQMHFCKRYNATHTILRTNKCSYFASLSMISLFCPEHSFRRAKFNPCQIIVLCP